MVRRYSRVSLALLVCLALGACDWKVPITPTPTRDVVGKLIGDWFATSNGNKLRIRKYDAKNYVLAEGRYGEQLYSAFHSDIDDWQLVSVRQLNADGTGQWSYLQWRLIDDNHLEVRSISEKIVPYSTSDSAEVVKLLKANRQKPELFNDGMVYAREQ
jgi:hypothetical protein